MISSLLRSMDRSRKSSAGDGNPALIPPSIMGMDSSKSVSAEKKSSDAVVCKGCIFTKIKVLIKDVIFLRCGKEVIK